MNPHVRKALCGVNRTVGPLLPVGLLARSIAGIPGRVHVDDQMYRSDASEHVRHYVEDADSAMDNIQDSLVAAGRIWSDVKLCLDFGCGYGRVTRWLADKLSPERVTAADVDPQAARFCAHEFGVRPLVIGRNPTRLRFGEQYDLVFIGSVLTHLPLPTCADMLDAIAVALRPRGMIVFSTQGESCLAHLDWYGEEFVSATAIFRASCDSAGAAFVPYRGTPSYGITIMTRPYVERLVARRFGEALRLIRFAERGWDQHQDVWSYVSQHAARSA